MQFSPSLRAMINRALESVEHVEVLLLLKRDPQRSWSAQEVADELRRSPKSVMRRLRDLSRSRLIDQQEDRFRYSPGLEEETIEELEREYESRRVRLIEAIYSRSIDSARTFADAFRLWGDENDR